MKDRNALADVFEVDVHDSVRNYRTHFLGYEHLNFYGTDDQQVGKP